MREANYHSAIWESLSQEWVDKDGVATALWRGQMEYTDVEYVLTGKCLDPMPIMDDRRGDVRPDRIREKLVAAREAKHPIADTLKEVG